MTRTTPAGSRLRVTVVSSYGAVGGAERWLLDLLDATDRLDVDAVLLGPGPLEAELTGRGIPVQVIDAGRRPGAMARPAVRLTGVLRDRRPDVVLANGFKAGLVAGGAGLLAGVRTVWVKHDHSFDGRRTALVSALCAGVLATSPTLAAAAGRAVTATIPPPRHPAPVLDRAGARAALAARGVVLGDRPVLAVVGRLVPYKGCADAVRALAEPGALGWQLVLVGADDPNAPGERSRLQALAARLDVTDRVGFAGDVALARDLYRAFDAVAVLTRPDGSGPGREGFGITALEAMAAGLPVITTGPGPVADRVGARAGIVIPPGDPTALARALERLVDPGERRRLGTAGAGLVADHPTARICADELARHLATIAGRPGAGRVGRRPVSVVITVRDEADVIDDLVDALRAQLRLPADELVVVDGGSRDGTAELLAAHARADGRVRVLSRPGAGISAGRNVGVQAARNDLVACTDAGCTPAAGWLEALRAAAGESAPADLLTGVYRVDPGHGPLASAMAAVGYPEPDELRHPSLLVRAYGALLGRTFDPTMPTGRSVAFTRDAWARAGGFPEHLQTGEDVCFGREVARHGRAVMVADAEVSWVQRTSLCSTARMYFAYGLGSAGSRDRRLLGRDLARAGAYAIGPLLLAGGRASRVTAVVGAAAYLSLPLRRAARGPAAAQVAMAVPVAAALRDLAKAAGCLVGLCRPR